MVNFHTIGLNLLLKFTNRKCQEYQVYIIALRFRILLLRVDDLFVLQELISHLLPDQRT